ncbi:MAG: hypothetical protein NC541_15500 [bacterium]|nr:hypothetical protein [bacterium]
MKFKKVIAVSTVTCALLASTLTVSAAGLRDVFDAKYYAEKYADLKAAFGNNEKALYRHYLTYGIKEGRTMSPVLDVAAYRAAYADLEAAFGDNWDAYVEHYLTYGIKEHRTEGILFDPIAYAEAYPDIKAAFGDDVEAIIRHYLTFGIKEGRTAGVTVAGGNSAASNSGSSSNAGSASNSGSSSNTGSGSGTVEHVHTFSAEWTTDGENHWHAATCDHDVKSGEAAHNEVPDTDKNKEETCGEAGWENATKCSVCGKAMEEGTEVQPDASKHTFSEEWESDGTNHWHAATCGHDVKSGEAAHNEVDDDEVNTPATCTEAGWTGAKKCSVCEAKTKAGTEVPATGHTEVDDDEVNTPATCTEAGVAGAKKCSVCEAKTNAGTEVSATGHTEVDDDEVNTPATCTEAGVEGAKKCSVCEAKTNAGTEVAATGHTDKDEDGTCDVCSESVN